MDAGKALHQFHPHPQIAGRQGGVLPGGALAVVFAADDGPFAPALDPPREIRVQAGEGELADGRQVAAQGQDLAARGQDVVGGDVVPGLQPDLAAPGLRQGRELGKGHDVGAPHHLHRRSSGGGGGRRLRPFTR